MIGRLAGLGLDLARLRQLLQQIADQAPRRRVVGLGRHHPAAVLARDIDQRLAGTGDSHGSHLLRIETWQIAHLHLRRDVRGALQPCVQPAQQHHEQDQQNQTLALHIRTPQA
ncbi:hypothetical protein D3C80_1517990 [compost metagenome]